MTAQNTEELNTLNEDHVSKGIIVSGLDAKNGRIEKPLGEQSRATRRQELMVLLGNIGLLSSGMGLVLPTVIINQLKDPTELVHFNDSQVTWLASINTLSCPLGGLLSGYLLDKLGRKNTLYVLNMLSLTAWTLMALAVQNDVNAVYIQLLFSRFIIGISIGLSSAVVGVYSAEISTPRIRGRLILGTSLSVASGIMLIYTLGYFIRNDYHLIAMICCGYQILSLLCVLPMPESPSWLISKNRLDEAKTSLNFFRGLEKKPSITHPEVLAEFNTLQKSIKLGIGEKKISFWKSLRLPEVYKPLLIMMSLFAFQQTTGIFVVVVYAAQISVEAGVTIDPLLCAIFIGVARVSATIPMVVILEKWGRRRSGIISALGMCVCMFILAAQKWFEWLQSIPYLPVIAIVSFIVLSTFGLYTLPFFMISELFPQKVRGPASGLTVAFGMFVAFICIKTYPDMKASIGNEYCFIVYGCCSLLAFVFIYFVLPETRGRTLLEIEQRFRGKNKQISLSENEVEMQEVFVKNVEK